MSASPSPDVLDTSDGDRLLPIIPTVLDRTGLSRAGVYDQFASGALRSVKIGRRRMVRASDLAAFIANLPEA